MLKVEEPRALLIAISPPPFLATTKEDQKFENDVPMALKVNPMITLDIPNHFPRAVKHSHKTYALYIVDKKRKKNVFNIYNSHFIEILQYLCLEDPNSPRIPSIKYIQ